MSSTVFTLASALLLPLITSASPLLHSSFAARSAASISGYDYQGCYTEADGMRALTGLAYFDDYMTVAKCATACSSFSYFGVEYGRECYCGNALNKGSVLAPVGDCSFTCPGYGAQTCGAGNRLDLYLKASTAAPAPAPDNPTAPTPATFSSIGCYSDPAQTGAPRALPDKTYPTMQ
jgi:hypothetical protein